ncbi:ergosterol biosynthesis ERG4/ERG24 [Radiomyces spectabilis]|uniref:ergosterol biosynthesis ERG4/ERG24 n=1 Tax=Radiomyces spectabilis TaxID=64574 RepID=UPI002220D17E|nr:ergosterol biosynthesis ERG4/ERG24 [Radiomyces spectabilis]KAI8373073.1 ergosterol biosynthesis ERG4/ERG24 [Radiomyces spectabilis]
MAKAVVDKTDGQPQPVNKNGVPLFKQSVTERDRELDNEVVYEFQGPVGVCAMMLGFPSLMYYFWVCLEYHQGKLITPSSFSLEGLSQFFWQELWAKIKVGAYPTALAVKIYMGYVLFSFILAYIMPGPVVEGLALPSLKGKKLKYLCNGLSAWYATLVTAAVVHITGIFRLTLIIDNFGGIMTTAILWGFTMTTLVYICSVINGTQHRMSGNFFYDYFMGAVLNPRIGHVDLKMWAETRVPWPVLFFLSVSCALKQYELKGFVSGPIAFMVLAHFLYVNACQKGEECIPTSWDIFYEKDGFMLIFWNMAGVPFTYCYASIYLMKYELTTGQTITHSLPYTVGLFVTLLAAYYIFDTGNSQKNRFRMEQNGSFMVRNAFPQLPYGHIKNPSYIKTEHGNLLLTDGWWGVVRKPHYTADLIMAMSWGLITGFGSFLPYFYFCFFVFVLTHRVSRDMNRCAKKYGKDWDRYCERVPYIFIPYVF